MNEFEYESFIENKSVIPNAAIYKKSDDNYGLVKFKIEDDIINGNSSLVVYSTTISTDSFADVDAVDGLDLYSVLFTYISYELDLDEESGLMEMQLCSEVTLASTDNDELVLSEEIIDESPEDLIPIYLDVIKSM